MLTTPHHPRVTSCYFCSLYPYISLFASRSSPPPSHPYIALYASTPLEKKKLNPKQAHIPPTGVRCLERSYWSTAWPSAAAAVARGHAPRWRAPHPASARPWRPPRQRSRNQESCPDDQSGAPIKIMMCMGNMYARNIAARDMYARKIAARDMDVWYEVVFIG